MEGFTVHKLNEQLLVSLYKLPGFRKMGSCVVRDGEGKKSGEVAVYYAGTFFQQELPTGEYEQMRKDVLKLAQNLAVKTKLGVATTRLNLSLALRKQAEKHLTINTGDHHASTDLLSFHACTAAAEQSALH